MKKWRVRLTVVVETFAPSESEAIERVSDDLDVRLVEVDRATDRTATEIPLEPWEILS